VAKSLNQEELEFVRAIESYKKQHDKLFLSWTEVLGIAKGLGYSRPVQSRTGSARCGGVSTSSRKSTSKAVTKSAGSKQAS